MASVNKFYEAMPDRRTRKTNCQLVNLQSVACLNPLRPNNDESQTSHCNIKGVSFSEVMRIENMVTQVKF